MFNRLQISGRINQLLHQGYRYLSNEQVEEAQGVFKEGLQLAQQHHQYCSELDIQSQTIQIHVYYTYDQQAAVDAAVRLISLLRGPEYQNCHRQRIKVYDILIHAYFYRDCLGYEEEIRDSMEYVEKNFLISQRETRLRFEYIRAELDYENRNYKSGRDRVMQYIAAAEFAHSYRKGDGYLVGRRMMYALGEISLAHKYAELSMKHSQAGGYQRGVADGLLWQGVYAKRLGNDGEAQRLIQRSLNHYEQFQISHTLSYFDALAEYHELCGEHEQAQKLLEEQFEELPARGSLHDLALAHLQYCRFLGRTGQTIEIAIQDAHGFIQTLPKPEVHEPALEAIKAGNYHQFDWQRI